MFQHIRPICQRAKGCVIVSVYYTDEGDGGQIKMLFVAPSLAVPRSVACCFTTWDHNRTACSNATAGAVGRDGCMHMNGHMQENHGTLVNREMQMLRLQSGLAHAQPSVMQFTKQIDGKCEMRCFIKELDGPIN